MIVNQQQMDEINAVQYNIFKEFHRVCAKLCLNYYLVHGSLLGALRHQGFFPMDDDIDVAMSRKDYDIFMANGQSLMDSKYFVQSHLSEDEYPLAFGKVRANDTAFIQPVLKNCKVHKGIYIDIFPIDNYPVSKLKNRIIGCKINLLSRRVNKKLFQGENKHGFKAKLLDVFYRLLMPSWKHARNKLVSIYNNVPYTGMVIVRGGKAKEAGIPFELFGKPAATPFGELSSFAPNKTDEYLKLIYGDYMHYEPMGKDMVSATEVKISAEIVDVNKSYDLYD